MNKFLSGLLIALIMVGLCVFIFSGDEGINETTVNGHKKVTDELRSFNYVTD